ncbi:MAG TPA: CHASE3 domain-containing protein [Tepidisphaeraceae bacterium]|nr:CHASE3 domain-containing protein [Tepidisphaeraceae bacterium]
MILRTYRQLRFLLVLMVGVLLFSVGVTFLTGNWVIHSERAIVRQHDRIDQLREILSTLKDAETGQRGYLLVGEETYLQPYLSAVATLRQELSQLKQQAAAGDLPERKVEILSSLIFEKLNELHQSIELRREKGASAALEIVRTNIGKNIMDRIRAVVADMISDQSTGLSTMQGRVEWATTLRSLTFLLVTALEFFFCIWAYRRIVLEMGRHEQAANDARRQKDLLSVTLSSIGDAVLVTDLQGRLTFMNTVAESLTGWPFQEARNRPITDVFRIINEQTRTTVESPFEKVLRFGAVVGLANHTLLIRRDGTEIPIDDSGAPIVGADQKIYGVVVVFRDFSEHKKAEQRLVQAKAEAERANKAKDHFLATLSHELRTPLTPVLATLDLWQVSESVPEALKPDVQMLRQNVDLEIRLIEDLLDLTRIAKGKLSMDLQTVDCHEAVRSVLAILQADIAAKYLEVSLNLGAARHHVRADGARLRQIIWNLLRNAVKFTSSSGRITVQTSNVADDRFQLEIADSGIGMSTETLHSLFQPFNQGFAADSIRYGGLGLGLAIAKSLVEEHGGTISARSAGAGKGSTFIIALPTVDAPSDLATAPTTGQPKLSQRALRILLVEDHIDTATAMNRLLLSFGHQVRLADSVGSALALARDNPFDLLISDLGLPDGSGIDLLKELMLSQRLPAVALTGYGMEDDINRCLNAGFALHLTKPVDIQKLRTAIEQIANGANSL